jgi:hypothetical protein
MLDALVDAELADEADDRRVADAELAGPASAEAN